MSTARIIAVALDSPAHRAGLQPGDELLEVEGLALRDVIEYQQAVDGPHVALTLRRGGLEQSISVFKGAGESLGIELDGAVFDRVRTCDNHCPFCFIYQLPAGMRPSLSVKDDDYRLSFLFGNFTTLTRFTEADLERVISERLGPLYVSIHATDPHVRSQLLRNRRGATSLRWLGALLDAGIEVHGQIVVCPGINDSDTLDATLLGILDRFPHLASVGVVPLGVSAYNRESTMRPHLPGEAQDVLDLIDLWQDRFTASLNRRMVFASDEYFLMANRSFPEFEEYEGFPQHENGIGMARIFERDVRSVTDHKEISHSSSNSTEHHNRGGFFEWVDGAAAQGYRAPRVLKSNDPAPTSDSAILPGPVGLITAPFGARVLSPLLPALSEVAGVEVRLVEANCNFFGGTVAVTGLLTASDVKTALDGEEASGRYLLPDVVLSNGKFLDGGSPLDLPRSVEVVSTDGTALVGALSR